MVAHPRLPVSTARHRVARSWYLYVVEKVDDGDYEVLPIDNPVQVAAK